MIKYIVCIIIIFLIVIYYYWPIILTISEYLSIILTNNFYHFSRNIPIIDGSVLERLGKMPSLFRVWISDSIYASALFQGVLQSDEERTTGPSFEKISKVNWINCEARFLWLRRYSVDIFMIGELELYICIILTDHLWTIATINTIGYDKYKWFLF